MSPPERLLIASGVLAVGGFIGLLLRRPLRRTRGAAPGTGLPVGLIIVTAPFCTRCTNLRSRLDQMGLDAHVLDATTSPSLLTSNGIRTVPTLLAVTGEGEIAGREHRDFSNDRLRALEHTASAHRRNQLGTDP